ncbi:hypothetical protein Areg01_05260 [Actinoplanes regularis]|nr:hypothetical protein Areg01_05260 [Actinoplanes regularis]
MRRTLAMTPHLLLAVALVAATAVTRTGGDRAPTPAPVAATTTSTESPLVQSGPQNLVTRVQDTFISNVNNTDNSRGAFLHIGTPDNGTTKYRSLMQFDLSKLAGASIESASLRLYNSYTGSCDGWWMYATPITAKWNQTTVTWANQPAVSSNTSLQAAAKFGIGNANGCQDHPNFVDPSTSDGLNRLDVTAMVRAWVSGDLANNGIRLSAGESETKAYKDFCSMNPGTQAAAGPCSIAYHIPTLEIRFNSTRPVLATTNGGSKHIELYDGSDANAFAKGPFQRWAPDTYHSITDSSLLAGGAFGGGVDVKLRPAGLYGSGQVMVVADNSSGFVGVIPYPALAGRKWAINVGGSGLSNIHGAELMPDGNVAVALARSGRLQVFTAAQGVNWTAGTKPVVDVELPGAHQVLYDPAGPWLWAIGNTELVKYRYTAGTGAIEQDTAYPLPPQTTFSATTPAYGHDLNSVPGDPDRLWVTTNGGVVQFSKSATASCGVTGTATQWPDPASAEVGSRWCGDYPGVGSINANRLAKSVDTEPGSGRVAMIWADEPEGTSTKVTFVSGATQTTGSSGTGPSYYKARWLVAAY